MDPEIEEPENVSDPVNPPIPENPLNQENPTSYQMVSFGQVPDISDEIDGRDLLQNFPDEPNFPGSPVNPANDAKNKFDPSLTSSFVVEHDKTETPTPNQGQQNPENSSESPTSYQILSFGENPSQPLLDPLPELNGFVDGGQLDQAKPM